MRILWIKTELLHPVDKGGRIRTYQMLRALRRENEITYLTLDDGSAAHDARARAGEYCDRLEVVPFGATPKGTPRFYAELLRNALSPLPYAVWRYRVPALRRRLERTVAAEAPDVVICDFLAPAVNVPDSLGVPTVLFQHNVEAMIWHRRAAVASNAVSRAYYQSQWRRMRAFEGAACRRFDLVVAVSPDDGRVFREEYGVGRVAEVPTGVDTAYFRPRPNAALDGGAREILFVGSMDWMPNEDAAVHFVEEILPLVKQRVPEAHFTIVGRHPTPRVIGLAGDGVTVTGSVPDVRPFLERAAVCVVPLRVGGGTRLKIYEAMAMEKAVVSTTIGAEGLDVEHGQDIVLADTPPEFATRVAELLADAPQARRIGAKAGAKVRSRYGWERVADDFASVCRSLTVGASIRAAVANE